MVRLPVGFNGCYTVTLEKYIMQKINFLYFPFDVGCYLTMLSVVQTIVSHGKMIAE
jgi:hypothetical protein